VLSWGGRLRVLVTGGAGFIGSHTVDRFLADGFDVVVLDDLRGGCLENVSGHVGDRRFRFVRGDIRDSHLVKELVTGVDGVLHLAALVSVPESFRDPALYNDVNVGGTLNLLKACVDFGVNRFVYASSCAVYGEAESLPIKEGCPAKPMSPYAVSKLTAENYVCAFHEKYGLETVCLRYFNVYGPRQTFSDYSGVITQFLNRIENDLPLVVFGDGTQTRDFVYVQDVAEANILALNRAQAVGGIFNIGTGVATSIKELANVLLELTKKTRLKIIYSEAREGDIMHSVADISKARNKLGYSPRVSLNHGLRELVQG